ncbi:hypothetical protein, partial [Planktothrix sp.]
MNVWTLNPDEVENIQINDSLIRWREEGKEVALESGQNLLHLPQDSGFSKINKFQQFRKSKFLSDIEKIPTTEGISLVT